MTVKEAATVAVAHDTNALAHRHGLGGETPRSKRVVFDRTKAFAERGGAPVKLRLEPTKKALRLLERADGPVSTRLLVSAVDAAGNESVLTAKVRIGA